MLAKVRSEGLFARAMRSSLFIAGSYAVSQALRLASNLILSRLLFPDAFGIMALVNVVLVGLSMLSDLGLGPAIAQSGRGDDPRLLNTAFSLNVLRGGLLWLLTCALAVPAAHFYAAPDLALLMPAAGLTLLIAGFTPIRVETANRHLLLGRVTVLDLISQAIGIVVMILLAYVTQSVWSLVMGAIVAAGARVLLMRFGLPGQPSALDWDREAVHDLVHFGKWIFLSSVCGFLLSQGDKAIFGRYLTLQDLGTYSIGYFLASFPILLAGAVTMRIMIPIYRDRPPYASAQNAARLRRMRFLISGGTMGLLALMALIGPWLVGVLYDDRYGDAAKVVQLIALAQLPVVVGMTYDQGALAAGDSRSYFFLLAAKAVASTGALFLGVQVWGLAGALVLQGLALAIFHLAILQFARQFRIWDGLHDLVFGSLSLAIVGMFLWFHG